MSSPEEMWAITSYFNPQHYRRRLLNYGIFRRRLRVPLLAIELSFDGRFELGEHDADLLIQLSAQDVLWQKERLLNRAAQSLPESCRKVICLDCDTFFGADDWPEAVSRALDDFPLVQPFDRVHHLARAANLQDPCDPSAVEFTQRSIPLAVAAGQPARECLAGIRLCLNGSYVMGMGWGVQRQVLDRVGFYDACIVGGGARALVSAAYGCFEETIRLNLMNERQGHHYLDWATRFFQTVQGKVSAVAGALFHLWHGTMEERRYKERYKGLQRFFFDPYLDLALDPKGFWRWNSDKPKLHQYVRDYFARRREDAVPSFIEGGGLAGGALENSEARS